MRTLSACACVFLVLSTAVLGQRPAEPSLPPETERSHDGWFAELPPALAEARKTGKDMLIDFGGSDWCAPCQWLKENVFAKPEFNEVASKSFVLVDIDTLAHGLSPERKERYLQLQKQYHVESFPSVFLTTPEGEPYAWTTYIPATESRAIEAIMASRKLDSPERFWAQIQPLIARGRVFRDGLAKARELSGIAKADAMIDALSQVRADLLHLSYAESIRELKALDPSDHRGFLAYLDGCRAYAQLEALIGGGYDLNPKIQVADVDALIARHHLTGETLQQALAMKATLLVIRGESRAALDCLRDLLAAQDARGPFDRGDYMPATEAGLALLRQRVAQGTAKPGDRAAEFLALHKIFESQALPDRYRISCHASERSAFEPNIAVRKPIGEAYGNALLEATASLKGEERARALGKGLEDTFFLNDGTIRTIITKLIPELVGDDNAAAYLPKSYAFWITPPRAPAPVKKKTP